MKQPELGKKISELRKSKGLTQEELVEKCNLNVRTIQRIEAGEVTPRRYTVNAILEVLEYDFNSIQTLVTSEKKYKLLNLAWIFGIVYFIIGFFEFSAEYYRFTEKSMLFSNAIYILIKVIALTSFSVFIYGFVIVGELFKNSLLKISAYILGFTLLISIAYDIISLYNEIIPLETSLIIESISFGFIQILLGIALLKLKDEIGNMGLAAGILEILTGIFFLTVILAVFGLVIYIPTLILEIVILYMVAKRINSEV